MTDTFLFIETVTLIVGLYLLDFGLIRKLVATGLYIINIPLILSTSELTKSLINEFVLMDSLLALVSLALMFLSISQLLHAYDERKQNYQKFLELLV